MSRCQRCWARAARSCPVRSQFGADTRGNAALRKAALSRSDRLAKTAIRCAPRRCPRPRAHPSRSAARNPGPSGVKNSVRRPDCAARGTPFTSRVSGCTPPEIFSAIRRAPSAASSSRAPFGGNMMRGAASACRPRAMPGRKRCSGSGSRLLVAKIAPFGACGSAAGNPPEPRERIEQDRRRRGAADEARHRRAIRPADPDADGAPAVEADRPGVAIAVAGAGLERDAPADGVLRRRRADQHVADIPGGDRIEQAARRGALAARRAARSAAIVLPPRASPA